MPDKPISPLRQRMIEDMTARRFKEKAQKDYLRHVRAFAAFLGRAGHGHERGPTSLSGASGAAANRRSERAETARKRS
jgi:hypothetical protein